MTYILIEAADQCLGKINGLKIKRKNDSFNWTEECNAAKKKFRKCKRDLHRDPSNLDKRQKYLHEKKDYRKILYKTKQLYKENKIRKISGMENNNPKMFWKTIKSLTDKHIVQENLITSEEWLTHFKDLFNNKKSNNSFHDYINCSLPLLENNSATNTHLDKSINEDEVEKAIASLDSGTSAGKDAISIDMNKCCKNTIKKSLCHLFNHIFNTGIFPDCWNTDIIVPLHKNGNINDPANYRPIVLTNIFYKIFSKILCNRLTIYTDVNKLWKPNQCGFRAGHRTDDNVFVLNTLREKYVSTNSQKLYVAFVDFKKFF